MAFGLITLLAAGAGGGGSILVLPLLKPKEEPKVAAVTAAAHGAETVSSAMRELPPIVTNLAAPSEVWVRLEGSVVIDRAALPEADGIVREIAADTLAYLRTLSLPQLQGAGGLADLRQDLNERIAIRAGGKARELVIHTLVIQ